MDRQRRSAGSGDQHVAVRLHQRVDVHQLLELLHRLVALVLQVGGAAAAGFQRHDLRAQLADGAQRRVDRGHLADDVVLRGLALRRIGAGQRVNGFRQRAGAGHHRLLLRLAAGIVEQGGELVLQAAEQAGDVAALARGALHRIDRLQRGLRRLQSGDGAGLLKRLRLQRGVDLTRDRPGDDTEAEAVHGLALLRRRLGDITRRVGVRHVVRHQRQLAADIGQAAGGDRQGGAEAHGLFPLPPPLTASYRRWFAASAAPWSPSSRSRYRPAGPQSGC